MRVAQSDVSTTVDAPEWVAALTGIGADYRVILHAKPAHTYLVWAESVDMAQRKAIHVYSRTEGKPPLLTGATIQRIA